MRNAGTAAERHEPVPGSTVGPWLILQGVGAGSYGIVYLARRADRPEADPVALKVARLPRDHALPTEKGVPFSEENGGDSEELAGSADSGDGDGSDSSKSSTPPQRRERRRDGLIVPAWLSWASAAVVGGLIVAAVLELRRPRPLEPEPPEPVPWSMAEERHEPEVDTPDAGVGEEALLSTVQTPRPVPPEYGVGLPMPKNPQPGQKKPPCDGAEVAALGACWVVLKKDPPCGKEGYDYGGLCVRASFEAPRQPTSGEP